LTQDSPPCTARLDLQRPDHQFRTNQSRRETTLGPFHLLIDGKLEAGDSEMSVINPANEDVLSACPRASMAQLDKAVAAAKRAFPAWSATPMDVRRKALLAMADAIQGDAPNLARLLTQEQGKPIGDATGEVYGCAAFFRYFSTLDLPEKVVEELCDPQGCFPPPPAGRGRRHCAVELPPDPDGLQGSRRHTGRQYGDPETRSDHAPVHPSDR